MNNENALLKEDILSYLEQHEQKDLLRFLTCGSVDDGKSTLIGRLLHDSKMIFEDQLAAITQDSKKVGTTGDKVDLALLVDGLQSEREQGITIDVAYRYFSTDKRKFIIADTPGHEQYTRNMVTGASTCDLAILMVDARAGVKTQTRRHSFLASLLGIKHVIVAVNKMDLMDYSEQVYKDIQADFLEFSKQLNITDIQFVPISALEGDNVVNVSEHTPWYDGETLMTMLENIEIQKDANTDDFRFPVQYVNRPNLDFRGFCGTIASGVIRPGEQVMALPSRRTSTVKEVVTFDGNLEEAYIDQAVTLTLTDEIDISRGDMLVKVEDEPEVGNRFNANIVWMTDAPLETGRLYDIKLGPTFTSGTVKKIHHQTDVNTLEQQANPSQLQLNEIGLCELTLNQPIAFDAYQRNHVTGSFIVIDRLSNVTIGAGMVAGLADSGESLDPASAEERERRLAQKPAIIACNGRQAPALALAVERALFDQGKTAVVVNEENAGDADERRRVAQLLTSHGLVAIAVNLGTDIANAAATADSEQEIPEAVSKLVQELIRSKRV
ncbi:MAG TPA: sulfate adenylyltransferase subunit CysN [Alteromonas sp.]|nr:sulfate adenylyltransferase subunit CysN [Alteromonas sp.]